MIDTHAHLSRRFCNLTIDYIEDLKSSGLKAVVMAASNLEESSENVKNAKANIGFLFAAAGVHPQDTDPEKNLSIASLLEQLAKLVDENRNDVIAIGECGLDFSQAPVGEKDRSIEDQVSLFRGQIEIAKQHKLPLIIHARKAVDETLEELSKHSGIKGVLHCYTGGKKRISKVLALGPEWFFGIDGNVTYEDGLKDVVKDIPKEKLVLETDSPFLTPTPFRGEVNKPSNIKYIYEEISKIWGMDTESTEKIIDTNAKKCFGISF